MNTITLQEMYKRKILENLLSFTKKKNNTDQKTKRPDNHSDYQANKLKNLGSSYDI